MCALRVGIIGCGGVSGGHVQGYDALEDVSVVGLADPRIDRAQTRRDQLRSPQQASVYEDYRVMLDGLELDAVSICTPHVLHFEQTMSAFEHGLHVLCEKPLTTDPDQDWLLIQAARGKKRILAVRYQRHSMGTYRRARELIAEGAIGRVEHIIALLGQSWYRNQFKRIARDGSSWRIARDQSGGGQLVDSGSHLIDALLWVTGLRPVEVFAYALNKDFEVDVCSTLSISLKGGALASVAINGDCPVGYGYFSIEIGGTEGVLKVSDKELWLMRQDEEPPSVPVPESSNACKDFVQAIRGDGPVAASGEDGLYADLVAQAAFRSIQSGRPERCEVDRGLETGG